MTSYEVLSLPLSDPRAGSSRERDVDTAKNAAKTCNADSQRQRIVRALAARTHGATTAELEAELHVVRNTISTRLRVMEKDGLVERFGQRLNSEGNPMQVWYLRFQSRVVDVETGTRL